MDTNANHQAWLLRVTGLLDEKMRHAIKKAREIEGIPYTTANENWVNWHINWWTNGFWPASMWQMHLMTGENLYRDEALRAETMMDDALRNFKDLDHDAGFMWLIHSGVRHALEKNADSYDRTLFAANMLAARFNPNGFIRAWNGPDNAGWAIIDCMMNLPLLYWASEVNGDPRYRLMAMRHADTAMEAFVRPDGSCNHIVIFDPETGDVLDKPAGQGYEPGSSWTRGQAWALYGFTLSYLCTGKAAYLDTAKRVANYFVASLPEDGVPPCDFRQPAEPDLKDCAAGAIAASGLLTLAQALPACEGQPYEAAALRMLTAMESCYADWTQLSPAILHHCTAAWHDIPQRHITMDYADYFFIEAIGKLQGEKRLFWLPNHFE